MPRRLLLLGLLALTAPSGAESTSFAWEPPTECVDGSELVLAHFTLYRDRVPVTQFPADATNAVIAERVESCYEMTATGICGDTDELSESWYSNRACTVGTPVSPRAPEGVRLAIHEG